jgi:phosphoserine aminotransferase
MSKRAYNFNAGPAALPLEVLQQAQEQFVDYNGIGMSIMEISHRSKEYEQINDETQQLFRELLNIPNNYKILFLQGGASTQFGMIPMNFAREGKTMSYIHTGAWASKAISEAKLFGEVQVAYNGKEHNFSRVPTAAEIQVADNANYVHITSNETIGGIQFKQFPNVGNVPLIGDMSSDILCRPFDITPFGMIYAGAQKNLGPSGVTLAIVREDLLEGEPANIPTMMKYSTHVENNSLYNTPPAFSVYMVNLVLKWLKGQGGLAAIEQKNIEKTNLIYNTIDASGGFYKGVADKDSRSTMNITFRMATEELESKFAKEAQAAGFVGLKGHRSVGGLRASTYNAVPREALAALQQFMVEFQKNNG